MLKEKRDVWSSRNKKRSTFRSDRFLGFYFTQINARIANEMVLYKQGVTGERDIKKVSIRGERGRKRGSERDDDQVLWTYSVHRQGEEGSLPRQERLTITDHIFILCTRRLNPALGDNTREHGSQLGRTIDPGYSDTRTIDHILAVRLLLICNQLNSDLLLKEKRRKQLTGRPRTRQPVRHFRRKVVAIPMKTTGKAGQKAWR